jgi:branched-chain amino acid transport system permease protein
VLTLLLTGVSLGAVYALMALSLVFIFRATRLVNFAHGQIVSLGVFVFLQLALVQALPGIVAIVIAVVVVALAAVGIGLAVRRMEVAGGELVPLVSTFGLMLVVSSVIELRWGSGQPYVIPAPFGKDLVEVFGSAIPRQYLSSLAIAVLGTLAMALFLARTQIGLQIRAAVDSVETSELLGVPTRQLRIVVWCVGTLAGLLAAFPYVNMVFLDTHALNTLMLKGFTAAALGGFRSFTAALIGGLSLGVLEVGLSRFTSGTIADLGSMAAIIAMLFIVPRGMFALRSDRD